jgi:hypothetical protein
MFVVLTRGKGIRARVEGRVRLGGRVCLRSVLGWDEGGERRIV